MDSRHCEEFRWEHLGFIMQCRLSGILGELHLMSPWEIDIYCIKIVQQSESGATTSLNSGNRKAIRYAGLKFVHKVVIGPFRAVFRDLFSAINLSASFVMTCCSRVWNFTRSGFEASGAISVWTHDELY